LRPTPTRLVYSYSCSYSSRNPRNIAGWCSGLSQHGAPSQSIPLPLPIYTPTRRSPPRPGNFEGDPYQVRQRLALHAGAVTKASTERCGNPNRDPLRSHVRHCTARV
jgi:hypothetical protein